MMDGMLGKIAPPDYVTDTLIDMSTGALEASSELLDSIPDPEGKYLPPIINSIEDATKFIKLCKDMSDLGFIYSKVGSTEGCLIFNSGSKAILVRI